MFKIDMLEKFKELNNEQTILPAGWLKKEYKKALRFNQIFSLVLFDLDDFKVINDTYGHSVGDEVLKTYTQSVLSTFRNYDLVARYGGEEFVIASLDNDFAGAADPGGDGR